MCVASRCSGSDKERGGRAWTVSRQQLSISPDTHTDICKASPGTPWSFRELKKDGWKRGAHSGGKQDNFQGADHPIANKSTMSVTCNSFNPDLVFHSMQ